VRTAGRSGVVIPPDPISLHRHRGSGKPSIEYLRHDPFLYNIVAHTWPGNWKLTDRRRLEQRLPRSFAQELF
jgi:hypothetical protein